jgi:hypothetical protein
MTYEQAHTRLLTALQATVPLVKSRKYARAAGAVVETLNTFLTDTAELNDRREQVDGVRDYVQSIYSSLTYISAWYESHAMDTSIVSDHRHALREGTARIAIQLFETAIQQLR